LVPEIKAVELAQRLAETNPPKVIDVREPDEYAYCHIEGAQLRPLGEIGVWARELDREAEYVLQCHSGLRSAQAAMYLQSAGFKHIYNLRGGIDAWSVLVDPSVPRY
jgi:rhodanese-related sulfurtransferase